MCFADREQECYSFVLKLVNPKTVSDIHLIKSAEHPNMPFCCGPSFQEAVQALSLASLHRHFGYNFKDNCNLKSHFITSSFLPAIISQDTV